jgi:hypothetical protein
VTQPIKGDKEAKLKGAGLQLVHAASATLFFRTKTNWSRFL